MARVSGIQVLAVINAITLTAVIVTMIAVTHVQTRELDAIRVEVEVIRREVQVPGTVVGAPPLWDRIGAICRSVEASCY